MFDRKATMDEAVIAMQADIEKKYWLEKLSEDLEKSCFPYNFKVMDYKKIGNRQLDSLKFKITGDLYSKMMWITNNSDVRLHMLLVTLLVSLLYKYDANGDKEFTVGTPIYKQDAEGTFVNTILPIRNHLGNRTTFKEFLFQMKKTIEEAVKNQNYPIKSLFPGLNISFDEDSDDFPLFDIALLLTNIQDKDYIRHIRLNMIVSFLRTGESVEGEIEYNTLRYGKEAIERIADHFVRLAQAALFNVDLELSRIDILSGAEKKQLLVDLNNTRTPYPKDKTIQALFEEQVERNPGKIAVVYGNSCLTYMELNNKANRLARYLRIKGVKSDTVVGIMLDHSLEMIVGIVGVLKAGGAYLPLDSKLPLNRIIFMLEECRVSFLISGIDIIDKYVFTSVQDLKAKKVKTILTAPREQIRDINRLPLPDRSLVNYETYNKHNGMALVKNSVSLQATRGCPYKCLYCHKVWPKTHVFRSAENVFRELMIYYNIGVRRFAFIDDIFNLNRANSSRFFKLIIDNGLKVHLFFPNGIRGDLLTEEYIDLMVKAGTINIAFPLETASPRLQKLIKKNLNLKRFRQNIEYIIKEHPHVIVDFFSMHGFPSETEEEAMMTLDFIKSLKWLHFPFIWILKVYPNTDMEKLALEHGVCPEDIARSDNLGYHELPETLPFEKSFTLRYQADFFNNYFLARERLLHVLPYQMKVLSADEMVQKWNGYLPTNIRSFDELLAFLGIKPEELDVDGCRPDDYLYAPDLRRKMQDHFRVQAEEPAEDALRVLLLDVTLYFSDREDVFSDVLEPPLGPIYLLTYLNRQFGARVNGKIAKTRIDFDNYLELKGLLDKFKPDVIGIRALSYYKDFFHKIVATIRQSGHNSPIIAGGPYATSNFDTILQDKNVDVVVRGEGEVTFCELIQKIMENEGKLPGDDVLKKVAGIAYARRDTRIEEEFAPEIIMLDIFDGGGSEGYIENLEIVNRSPDLAYVIYTSGSTGVPKGVMVEHKNVTRLVKNTNYIDLREEDRLLLTGAFGFDITTFEFWAPLLNGLTLYLVDRNTVLDAEKLRKVIAGNDISILHLIPQLFNQLAAQQPGIFAKLRYFLVGGDLVSPGYINRIRNKYGDLKILHMYGPTENTTFSTFFPISENYEASIPIGEPIRNSTVYIVDSNNRLQPIGAAGELCVGGHGIARGYLNRPGLTREKFIPNPFAAHPSLPERFEPGEIIYKTGDMAKWLPGGTIEFLGRRDHQIKIRGIRIELGEIENVLRKHKGIEECVVVTKKVNREDRLIAYYIKKNKIELWPSMAEYFLYDELLYHTIAHDEARNEKYRNAIGKVVKDKVVLEIGPGHEAVLSQMCIEAGAKKVYAVEILEDAYRRAGETIKKLKLENKIILIHGDMINVELPEKVDCCVSEIVGTIGGGEGAAKIINAARKWLKNPKCMIPCKSITNTAAVTLPDSEFNYSFDEAGVHYTDRIFQHYGCKFDLRLGLVSFPSKYVLSSSDIFEELDFTRENPLEDEHDIYLEITNNSIMTGLIVWLDLYCDEEEIIATLERKYIWLPIYFPVFPGGEAVQVGDYIKAKVTRKLSENQLNPDFTLLGTLYKKHQGKSIDFTYYAPHRPKTFKGNPFYRKVFSTEQLKTTADITPGDLREFLADKVPDYMIPTSFVPLESIPLTPNGKVDIKVLFEFHEEREESIAPRNEKEKLISIIWSSVLDRENIGINENFFQLGGNSLNAVSIISRVNNRLGTHLPLSVIFEKPTIADFVEQLSVKPGETVFKLKRCPAKEYYSLSHSQKRLWFFSQMEPGNSAYNICQAFRFTGDFDAALFEQTLQMLTQCHESLRTSIDVLQGEEELPVQRIHNSVELDIHTEDISNQPGEQKQTILSQRVKQQGIKPFDLTRAPLFRVVLIKLALRQHVMIFVIHHIIADGGSIEILLKDFAYFYDQLKQDAAIELPPLALQYKDFAYWQDELLSRDGLAEQKRYWHKKLAPELPVLDLFPDFPRSSLQGSSGDKVAFAINVDLAKKLKAFSREQVSTLFMVLTAAFKVLLYRYTNQEDIIIGTLIAGRPTHEMESIVGYFINILALRDTINGKQRFEDFLGNVRITMLEAYDHQHYPFDKLVDELKVERNPGRTPVFDIMLVFQKYQGLQLSSSLESLEIDSVKKNYVISKYDLYLDIIEMPDQVEIHWEFCTDLYKKESIQRMKGHFLNILRSVVQDASQPISKINMISDREKRELLLDFNDTGREIPRDRCYHELFQQQVVLTPGRIAAKHIGKTITYQQLNEQANRIAHFLTRHGVGADTITALYLKRSIPMPASIIGIFKAGGAYLPVEIDYPAERIRFMMREADVKVVITDRESWQKQVLDEPGEEAAHLPQVLFVEDTALLEEYPADNPQTGSTPGNYAYMIYTSGTTGQPKGVVIHHMGMINHLYAKINDLSINETDRLAQTSSPCFDISVWQFLAPLLKGASTVIFDYEMVLNPEALLRGLQQEEITILQSIPSLMAVFLEMLETTKDKELKYLRWMIPTGEALPAALAREWLRHYPHIPLVNAYGPTEASDDITHYLITNPPKADQVSVPIGKPIQNMRVYILDKDLSLCPIGVRGEICTAGLGVGKGYWKDPGKTKQAFIANPYAQGVSNQEYNLLYRTGDLGYFHTDGNIECLGRKDNQVKIRGFRIELGEIEAVIMKHEAVRETAVIVKKNGSNADSMTAFLVQKEQMAINMEEFKTFLQGYLPNYMIPAAFVNLDTLPLTLSGKVDRQALASMPIDKAVLDIDKEFVPPQTGTEKRIADLWANVLDVRDIGIHDNFFDLGGHSLLIPRLFRELNKIFPGKVAMADFFEFVTLYDLARHIDGIKPDGTGEEIIELSID